MKLQLKKAKFFVIQIKRAKRRKGSIDLFEPYAVLANGWTDGKIYYLRDKHGWNAINPETGLATSNGYSIESACRNHKRWAVVMGAFGHKNLFQLKCERVIRAAWEQLEKDAEQEREQNNNSE